MNENEKNILSQDKIFLCNQDGINEHKGQITYQYLNFVEENTNIKFMGIFEGHGTIGKETSLYVNNLITKLISENKKELKIWSNQENSKELISKFFLNEFKKIQSQMNESAKFELNGACVISALIIDKKCYIINLGNCRAVLGGKSKNEIFSFQMSTAHIPDSLEEMERIKKSGGEVKNTGVINRIYKLNDLLPGLAVSRALGDCYGHDCGISEEPQINYKILDKNDEFIILGSKSIWDVMNSDEIVEFIYEKISNKINKEKIAEEIIEECKKRWIIINKGKDIEAFEKIQNDPNIDNNEKNNKLKQFVDSIENCCKKLDPNYQNKENNNNSSSYLNINPEEIFTGKHHIDNISCIICFFY